MNLHLESPTAKWKVSCNLNHSHCSTQYSELEIEKRCNDLKRILLKRFHGWQQNNRRRSKSFWESLFTKCFPDYEAASQGGREIDSNILKPTLSGNVMGINSAAVVHNIQYGGAIHVPNIGLHSKFSTPLHALQPFSTTTK